jgi:integrase
MKFTQKTVDAFTLPPTRNDVVVFDDDIPGFGLRVRSSGARTYVFQYALGRKHRRLTLGRASALRLEQAKTTARKLYAQTKLGHDPAGERLQRVASANDTFGAALKLYLAAAQSRLRAKTRRETERYTARTRVLADHELRTMWHALPDDDYGQVVKLLILTGQRRDEIGRLSWSEIVGDQVVLPPSRVKNKRPDVVPLSEPARAVLAAQPRRAESDLVFGCRGEGGFTGWSWCKLALDARIAEMTGRPLQPWVLHDVRRSVATGMADLGVAPHVIEAVLNHVSGHKASVAGIYNRSSYEREKPAAINPARARSILIGRSDLAEASEPHNPSHLSRGNSTAMFNPETNRNPSENPSNRPGYTEIVYDGVGQKPHNNHNRDERPPNYPT